MSTFVLLKVKNTLMKYWFWFLLVSTLSVQAQFQFNGIVKDAETAKVLPFASLSAPFGNTTIADVDGKFSITSLKPITEFYVSYIK